MHFFDAVALDIYKWHRIDHRAIQGENGRLVWEITMLSENFGTFLKDLVVFSVYFILNLLRECFGRSNR